MFDFTNKSHIGKCKMTYAVRVNYDLSLNLTFLALLWIKGIPQYYYQCI